MSIYVGNLSYQVTQEDITTVFAEYGTVKRVHLPTDRETSRPRDFGFVEMSTDAEEDAAISPPTEQSGWVATSKLTKLSPAKMKAGVVATGVVAWKIWSRRRRRRRRTLLISSLISSDKDLRLES